MEYAFLIDGLNRVGGPFWIRNIRPISQTGKPMEVQGAQLMRTQGPSVKERFYSPNLLFVGLVSELPPNPGDAPLHCVCIEDLPLPEVYTQPTSQRNLIVPEMYSDTDSLMLLLNTVCFILMDDFRYYQGLQWIAEAQRQQVDLQSMVKLAERITVNPCILVDHQRQVLATSDGFPITDQELQCCIKARQLTRAYLDRIQSASVYETLRSDFLSNSHLAWAFRDTLCIPVRSQGVQIATLIVQSYCTAFYHSVIRLMEPLAELMAQRIAALMQIQEDCALLHSLLFAELLRAEPKQEPILRRRLQEMGWLETENMVCAVCRPTANDESDLEQRYAALRNAAPGCRWCTSAGSLTLLLYPMEPTEQTALEAALAQQRLYLGCSWPTNNLMTMHYAHLQAQVSLEQGMLQQPEQLLHRYSSYFSGHVLQLSPPEVIHYLHPAVRALFIYDQNHEGTLLNTLERYLSGPDQPEKIAASLFIHRSTLFYRLNRIRNAVPQIDWSTGEDRMNLLLSLRLLKQIPQAE